MDNRASGCWAAAMGSRVRKPPKWVPTTAGPRTGVEGLLSFWWGSSQTPATHPLPWGDLCGSKATQMEGAVCRWGLRDRETEIEAERDRTIEMERDRQRQRQTEREMERDRDRQRKTER